MNVNTPTNPPTDVAQARLRAFCRSKDLARRCVWLTLVLVATLAALLALALLDYWLMLPLAVRVAGCLLLSGMVLSGVVRLVQLFRKPASLKEAALDVEAQRPALGCAISTAAE